MESPTHMTDAFRERLLPKYKVILEKQISDLESFFEKKDFDSMANTGHKIKGHGGMYGFMELSDLGNQLYQKASKKEVSGLLSLISQIKNFASTIAANK